MYFAILIFFILCMFHTQIQVHINYHMRTKLTN